MKQYSEFAYLSILYPAHQIETVSDDLVSEIPQMNDENTYGKTRINYKNMSSFCQGMSQLLKKTCQSFLLKGLLESMIIALLFSGMVDTKITLNSLQRANFKLLKNSSTNF